MNKFYKILSILAILTATLGTSTAAYAQGGSGGGGVKPTPAPINTSIVTFNNVDPLTQANQIAGWGATGVQATGYFGYTSEQFIPTITGAVSNVSLPVQQLGTGGNGSFTLHIYADNGTPVVFDSPSPFGALLGTVQGGKASRTTAMVTVPVSQGPTIIAGQKYWLELEPASQTRLSWLLNTQGLTGEHYGFDTNGTWHTIDSQAAFVIQVLP